MALPPFVAQTCGFIGTVCFILMLVPQIVLNAKNASTEGLSLGLVLSWHLAAALSAAFFTLQPGSLLPVCSMACFVLTSAIIEAQMIAYSSRLKANSSIRPRTIIIGTSVAFTAICFCFVGIFAWGLSLMSAEWTYLLGNVLPSLLLGLGFLPQFHEFISSWSIEGYSFGVTAFDVVGSIGNTVVLLAPANVQPLHALAAALPFLTIIGMHIVLLSIAAVIVCTRHRMVSPTASEVWESCADATPAGRILKSLSRRGFSNPTAINNDVYVRCDV